MQNRGQFFLPLFPSSSDKAPLGLPGRDESNLEASGSRVLEMEVGVEAPDGGLLRPSGVFLGGV